MGIANRKTRCDLGALMASRSDQGYEVLASCPFKQDRNLREVWEYHSFRNHYILNLKTINWEVPKGTCPKGTLEFY